MKKIRSKKITIIFTTIVIFVTTIALGNAEKIANETAFVHKSSTVTANQQTLVQAPSNVSKQGTKFEYVFGTSVDKGKFFNNSFADMKGEEKKVKYNSGIVHFNWNQI